MYSVLNEISCACTSNNSSVSIAARNMIINFMGFYFSFILVMLFVNGKNRLHTEVHSSETSLCNGFKDFQRIRMNTQLRWKHPDFSWSSPWLYRDPPILTDSFRLFASAC